jgi:predicted aminopeptidase
MKKRWLVFLASVAALGASVCLLGGCTHLSYYVSQANGHFAMMGQARPIKEWLAEPTTEPALRTKLEAAERIRRFAVTELKLPDNASYTSYADLKRPFLVWNIVATPALSLTPKTWCFAVAGCVSYRGYFSREAAAAEADALRAQGFDVNLYGVQAYSTLGYFSDPLLNTFIHYPEGELARTIFHELAHQVAYAKDDSSFNEGYATAVEQLGVERYLVSLKDDKANAAYREFEARRTDFRALIAATSAELRGLYASPLSDAQKRDGKRAAIAQLRERYASLKTSDARHWRGFKGYDRFFDQDLNNAHFAGIATYQALVPPLIAIYKQAGSFEAFHARSRALAKMSRDERNAILSAAQ